MRPISLEMRAFGPFAGSEIIHFDKLGQSPLFLINGPTGAGKTTILDAICFALYGRTTGDERQGKDMRCDLAAGTLLSEVSYTFELAGERYRVRRVPEQKRAKARGAGETTQSAEAQLWHLSAAGETLLVPRKTGEVNAKIIDLIGLNADQFCQVIVLPQGKFRELLLASSEQREAIFQQLFQTRLYSDLEGRLKAQATELQAAINTLEQKQKLLLEASGMETVAALDEAIAACGAQFETARKHYQVLVQAHQKSLERHRKIEAVYQKLQRDRGDFNNARTALEHKQKAALTAQQELAHALERWQNSRQQQSRLDELRQELVLLESYQERCGKIAAAQNALYAAKQAYEHAAQDVSDQEKVFAERAEKRRLSEAKISEALRLSSQLILQEQDLKAAAETLAIRRESDRCEQHLQGLYAQSAEIGQGLQKAEQALVDKVRQREIYESQWQQNQAGLLAGLLLAGAPCPVCGSTEHPQPAQTPDESLRPSIAGLEAARDQENQARAAREAQNRKKLALEQQLQTAIDKRDEYRRRLAGHGEKSAAELEQAQETLAAEITRLQTIVNQGNALKNVIDDLIRQEQNAAAGLEKAKQVLATSKTAVDVAQAQLRSQQAELPQRYQQQDVLHAALAKTRTTHERLEIDIKQAEQQWLKAHEAQITAQTVAQAAATRVEELRVRCEKTLAEWRDLQAATETEAGQDDETRVLEQSKQQELAAGEKKDLAARAVYELENRFKQLIDGQRRLHQTRAEQALLEQQYAIVGRLSDVANGKNAYNLSLHRFVLSVLLDDVLVEAGRRLHTMSKSRYRLLRREDPADRRSKAGLDLEVEDAYSGVTRPVATLSGGESFMAALSLALGLSDVVQAYSGGIRLDVLFIDEGFGSLDPEALDLAINALIDLQAAGRMVGIISHVPELKERIDLRLDLIAARDGSRTRMVIP